VYPFIIYHAPCGSFHFSPRCTFMGCTAVKAFLWNAINVPQGAIPRSPRRAYALGGGVPPRLGGRRTPRRAEHLRRSPSAQGCRSPPLLSSAHYLLPPWILWAAGLPPRGAGAPAPRWQRGPIPNPRWGMHLGCI